MVGIKGMGRKLPEDKIKGKELKMKLKMCCNSIESKRINIIIAYLNGNTIPQVQNTLGVSGGTVSKVINLYIKDPKNFYKTNIK